MSPGDRMPSREELEAEAGPRFPTRCRAKTRDAFAARRARVEAPGVLPFPECERDK